MVPLPADTRPGRVTLRVNDLDSVTAFYRDIIGFDVLRSGKDTSILGRDRTAVLVLRQDPDAPERRPDEAGLFHTAFRVPDRTSLADVLQRIEDQWELDGAADHQVSEALYLTDPEGNGIEVYHDRDRDAWETGPDGSVQLPSYRLDIDSLREQASGRRLPAETRIGHIHLEVVDIQEAEEFYVDTLGMQVRQQMQGALFLAAGDYHHHIGLNTWNNRSRPGNGRGLDGFELVLPDRKSLAMVRKQMNQSGQGVRTTRHGFTVTDPSGNTLHLRVQ